MRQIIYGIIVAILIHPIAALSETLPKDDEEALRRLELYRADILPVLSETERKVAQQVTLRAPISGNISGVKAYTTPSGEPIIIINQGTQFIIQQLAQSLIIATNFVKDDRFFKGYIRYLAYSNLFPSRILTASQFAEYYGFDNMENKVRALSEFDRSIGVGVEVMMMLFITAHELAHHIYGDVQKTPILKSAKERIEDEARADKWAAEKILLLGHSPEIAILSMLILQQTEETDREIEYLLDHERALIRAKKLIGSAIKNVETNPELVQHRFKKLADIGGNLTVEAYISSLRKLAKLIENEIHDEELMATDDKKLLESAKHGNIKSQIHLAGSYLTNKINVGELKKIDGARLWSEVAALNSVPYAYFDSAYAAYYAGAIIAKDGNDNRRACYYLTNSANMGLYLGKIYLDFYKKNGVCAD